MRRNRSLFTLIYVLLIITFLLQNSFISIVILLFFTTILVFNLTIFFLSKKEYIIKTQIRGNIIDSSNLTGVVEVETPSTFLLNKIIINLSLVNQLTNESIDHNLVLLSSKQKKQVVTFDLTSLHCGNMRLQINSVYFSDFLRIIKIKGRGSFSEDSFTLFPNTSSLKITEPIFFDRSKEVIQATNEQLSKQGDVFDFKTYELGDPVKNIHWKLSMKERELMVKEFCEETNQTQLVILETTYLEEGAKATADDLHVMVTTFVSIIEEMVSNHQTVSIAWLSQMTQTIQIETLTSIEDLKIIEKCLADLTYQKSSNLVWHFFEKNINQSTYSRIIYVHPDSKEISINSFPELVPITIGTKPVGNHYINVNQYILDISNLII